MDEFNELEQRHPNGKWISGYFVEDSVLLGLNLEVQRKSKYSKLVTTQYGIYIPPFISKISIEDNSFNLMGDFVDEWIMTDSVRYFDSSNFFMCGFERFAIVDKETGEVIFDTDRFIDRNQNNFLDEIPTFNRFTRALNKNPDQFYEDRRKGISFFKTRAVKNTAEVAKADTYKNLEKIKCARRYPLTKEYDGLLKKKIKVTDSVSGRTYTISYTTKIKKDTRGYRHYELYDAAKNYIANSNNNKIIDTDRATDVPFEKRDHQCNLWENILVAVAEDDILKEILSMAQKNSEGGLTRNRIVRIACDGFVTETGEIMQLIAKPKDETTLEIFPKARQFSPEELAKIEADYFATHPQLIK